MSISIKSNIRGVKVSNTGASLVLLFLIMVCQVVSSCNTGIESTKKIQLSREEKKSLKTTPEEVYLSTVVSPLLKDWEPGKKFIASDDKTALIFDSSGLPADIKAISLSGKELEYRGVETSTRFDGNEEAVIVFSEGDRIFRYRTGKTLSQAAETISTTDIPLTIDLDLISKISDQLTNKTFWIKTPLWYDSNGSKIGGRKFVKVTVEEVMPGNMVFPVNIKFRDENGVEAYLFMNYGTNGIESRNFPSLFSLSDPRVNYPSVSDENWALIQSGRVRAGMTKLECKLSLGNPTEVNSGHDWNNTLDIWQYTDGIFLRFQNGLLVDYRR